jgi:hypothetical protein
MSFDPKYINKEDQLALDRFKGKLTYLISYSAVMDAKQMAATARELADLEMEVLRRMHKD